MALPPLATVAELEERLGVPTGSLEGADLVRAKADLDDASALVRTAAKKDWVAEDGTSTAPAIAKTVVLRARSEEHTSELQSRENLVCRLLLEKKKTASFDN